MGRTWKVTTAIGSVCSARVRRVLTTISIVVVTLAAPVAVLAISPGEASAATPPAGYGEGSGFCSSAVPGGYTLGASDDNVYACGPANNSGTGDKVPASGAYQGFFEDSDYEFQCVELANRFAFDIWNLQPISGGSLDGADYASTLSSERGVTLMQNGTPGQPYLPGDIVSFTGTGALADGHVAVVMSSTYAAGDGGNYSVNLLQENASANGEASATVSNWSMGDPSGSDVTPSNFDALATQSTSPPQNGAFVSYDNDDYIIAGGAPLYISSWAVYGGTPPSSDIDPLSQTQWDALSAVPANGTFINFVNGANGQGVGSYVIAGGAPLYISSWSAYGLSSAPSGVVNVDSWNLSNYGNSLDHLVAVPANGTFVNFNSNGQGVGSYVIAGGAPLYISSWSAFGLSSAPSDVVQADSWELSNYGNPLDVLNAVPANGTFVNFNSNGQGVGSYVIAGGAPLYISSWSAFGLSSAPSDVVQADSWELSNYGNPLDVLNAVPANGTFVNFNSNGQGVGSYVIAGGAPLYISSWSAYGLTGAPSSVVQADAWDLSNYGNPLDVLNAVPTDGTNVQGVPSTNFWTFMYGGLLPAAASPSATQVPDTSLASFPLDAAPTISSSNATTLIEQVPASFRVTTNADYPTPSLTESGSLPSGVTFTDNGDGTATLAGIPAAGTAATYPLTITASNGISPDATQSFTLTVAPIGISTTSLPNGSVYSKTNKVSYSATLSASGGNPPYKWSLVKGSGTLPPGLTLKSTGVISGKAKTAGTYSFTVQVVDTKTKKTKTTPSTQNTATATLSITIS